MILIDNDFQALIPAPSPEELMQLESNLKQYGCRDPLVLWQGTLLDGHNRYAICTTNGISYQTVEIALDSRDDAINWIIDNQLGRRNISAEQRDYLLGLRYSREKDSFGGARASGQIVHLKSAEKIATQHGVSEKTVRRAEKFADGVDALEQLVPGTKQQILTGQSDLTKEEVSSFAKLDPATVKERIEQLNSDEKIVLKQMAKELRQKDQAKNKQKRIDAEKKEVEQASAITNTQATIYNCDCMDTIDTIPDIDLLIADPPYFTDGNYISQVTSYLNRVKPTGQAYVFAGADPAEVVAYLAINSNMILSQILVWCYNNTGQRQPNERYTSNYQLCFYFRGKDAPQINKPADGVQQYACQTINAPDARVGDRYHKWQKPLDLIDRLIRNSSAPGDFVFDPFAGSGTTLVAATKLGRIASGAEIDIDSVQICLNRGCIIGKF